MGSLHDGHTNSPNALRSSIEYFSQTVDRPVIDGEILRPLFDQHVAANNEEPKTPTIALEHVREILEELHLEIENEKEFKRLLKTCATNQRALAFDEL